MDTKRGAGPQLPCRCWETGLTDGRRSRAALPLPELLDEVRAELPSRRGSAGQQGGALRPLCVVSNWATRMICELNPHHGAADGTTLRRLVAMLAEIVALS